MSHNIEISDPPGKAGSLHGDYGLKILRAFQYFGNGDCVIS